MESSEVRIQASESEVASNSTSRNNSTDNAAATVSAGETASPSTSGTAGGDGERELIEQRSGGGNRDPRQRRFGGVRRGVVGTGLETTRKRMRLDPGAESLPYQTIAQMQQSSFPHAKFFFEQIKGYVMEADDDFESMIRTHAKIVLNPDIEYIIETPVNIRTACYIVGNGARVIIKCEEPFGFVIHKRQDRCIPVHGMWNPTFDEVIFERHEDFPGGCIVAGGQVLVNSCNFLGSLKTAIELQGGGSIRGCHFFACNKAVVLNSCFSGKVRCCYFERCIVGIVSRGHVVISNCTSQATYCFAFLGNTATLTHNSIINPYSLYDVAPIEMLCCQRNYLVPLATLHIMKNTNADFPTLDNNTFVRCKIYVGEREGVFKPLSCAFHYTTVIAENAAFSSVKIAHIHNQTMSFMKLMESEPNPDASAPERFCLCGERHREPLLHQIEMTNYGCDFHQSCSCDNPYYSSDDEW